MSTATGLSDIERAIRDRDPQLADLLIRYLAQGDPDPGKPEVPTAEDLAREDDYSSRDDGPPEGAMTIYRRGQQVAQPAMRGKTATEQKLARREAWQLAEASPYTPPRLKLGAILLDLYQRGDEVGRAALVRVFKDG